LSAGSLLLEVSRWEHRFPERCRFMDWHGGPVKR